MTKALCKAFMKCSQLERKCHRNSTAENINIKHKIIIAANYTKGNVRNFIPILILKTSQVINYVGKL